MGGAWPAQQVVLMPSKPVILYSKVRSFLGLGKMLPVRHHLGRPNFGDDINPWFFGHMSGSPCAWSDSSHPHFLGIGSIAAKATADSVIMGSGLIEPVVRGSLTSPAEIFAVRGELTAEAFGQRASHLGDPLLFIDLVLPKVSSPKEDRVGIVPHESMVGICRKLLRGREDCVLIDPRCEPLAVVRSIASCARIASQSLHGLIVADAYGIPNVWIAPSPGMVGATFKFLDYFTTLARPKVPVSLMDFVADPDAFIFDSGRYRWDRHAYLSDFRRRAAEGIRPLVR